MKLSDAQSSYDDQEEPNDDARQDAIEKRQAEMLGDVNFLNDIVSDSADEFVHAAARELAVAAFLSNSLDEWKSLRAQHEFDRAWSVFASQLLRLTYEAAELELM